MKKYAVILCMLSLILFSMVTGAANITVTGDTYVQPVAEFESSNDYPDILTVENDCLKFTSIPNRGRVIFSLILKDTGNEEIYHAYKTLPMIDGDETIYELGGIYFSRPWDQRDVQPYPLKYDILSKSGEEVSIKFYNEDFKTGLYTEIFMSLKEGSNTIEIEVNHENQDKEDIIIPYWDRFIVNPGGSPEDTFIDFSANKIILGESDGGWLGTPGETLDCPQPIQQWKNIESKAKYKVATGNINNKVVEIKNKKSGDMLSLKWDDEWLSSIKILTYGKEYEDTMGAFPGFRITRYLPEITIKPEETFSYNLSLTAKTYDKQ